MNVPDSVEFRKLEQRIGKLDDTVEALLKANEYLGGRIDELEQQQRQFQTHIWSHDESPKSALYVVDEIKKVHQTIADAFAKINSEPTFYRGQEVEVNKGHRWVAGLYVDINEDVKYAHGVYVFVTRMVEWWPDENIRPKQEDNK